MNRSKWLKFLLDFEKFTNYVEKYRLDCISCWKQMFLKIKTCFERNPLVCRNHALSMQSYRAATRPDDVTEPSREHSRRPRTRRSRGRDFGAPWRVRGVRFCLWVLSCVRSHCFWPEFSFFSRFFHHVSGLWTSLGTTGSEGTMRQFAATSVSSANILLLYSRGAR